VAADKVVKDLAPKVAWTRVWEREMLLPWIRKEIPYSCSLLKGYRTTLRVLFKYCAAHLEEWLKLPLSAILLLKPCLQSTRIVHPVDIADRLHS
jgi:hypothetical protein